MAYDEGLAERVRELLALHGDGSERKMFGGIAFMVGGNMAVGVTDERLIVRLSHEDAERALGEPHTGPMDFTGKPMRGFIYVAPEGTAEHDDLASWVEAGVAYASSLPPK